MFLSFCFFFVFLFFFFVFFIVFLFIFFFFFSSRRRHTRCLSDWSSDVCSSDLAHSRTISSMPGVFQMSVDEIVRECAAVKSLGIPSVILFGIPEEKDEVGRSEERRVGKECRSRGWQYD